MKKKIIISIFAILLIAVMSVLNVFAVDATANVNSANANRGSTVILTVTLAKGVTVGSGGIELIYDKDVLEFVKGEWNVSGTLLSTFDTSTNKGAFAYASGTQISGKVFTATFKVKNNAAFGDSAVKMLLQLKDGSNTDLSVANNSGKVTVTCKHNYSAWISANGDSHTRKCSVCQNVETVSHAFSNACDTKCDSCGYTRTTTHSYKSVWSSNETQHWHECSVCGSKKEVAIHTPGDDATETTPQICTTCGYVIKEALGHTHTYDQQWSNDSNGHWQVCTSCNQKSESEEHTYENSCDTSCDVCGYVRSISHSFDTQYSVDDEGHWKVCLVCKEKSEKTAHCYDNSCDTSCNDCDHTRTITHSYDAGVITKMPTIDTIGEKTYTCTVCGSTKVSELEYYLPDDTTDAGDSDDTDDSQTTEPPNVSDDTTSIPDNTTDANDNYVETISWIWIVVASLSALAIGIAIGVAFEKTRNKK